MRKVRFGIFFSEQFSHLFSSQLGISLLCCTVCFCFVFTFSLIIEAFSRAAFRHVEPPRCLWEVFVLLKSITAFAHANRQMDVHTRQPPTQRPELPIHLGDLISVTHRDIITKNNTNRSQHNHHSVYECENISLCHLWIAVFLRGGVNPSTTTTTTDDDHQRSLG